ncbi:transcription factor, putative [Sugiyamaella lignohabitans]|uniref:Transcription factor, putative n=1 Tax=Sugiyamaella lignohabitans TaxID=796027 RepID=A0A167FYW5_9ASCO|nr:transcription factor, putative [Sugiyamaella lignohabitans]ANB15882.1 transcription factor, putative [Sugiyamaella lignohabitans]
MAPQILGAKVKSVLSGDTIVLIPPKGGDQERLLALAYVSSPRLNNNEAFGLESREYLRKLLVGKTIQFKILYSINGRDYGDVISPVFSSLVEKVVADGIVKLRDDSSSKDGYEDDETNSGYASRLAAAQEKAQAGQLGLWSPKLPAPISTLANISKDIIESKKEFPAIIERVISGDRVQVRVLLDHETHYLGNVLIAGIRAPRSASPDAPAEPYGEAAKSFVTSRLLQRSVRLTFVAQSNTGLPIANIAHPAGDIADSLLRNGLASIADWQSQYLGAQKMSSLRGAEKVAKQNNLNLWKATGEDSADHNKSLNSFEALIAKVISPDTYVIRLKSDEERTVQLASVRAPRKNDPSPLDIYAPIAREFARSKFIAKKVNVTVIALRPKTEQFDERELVTLELQGKDIASILVANGYSTVIRHRKGDDHDRSPIWDELLELETQAISKQAGIHSKKTPAPQRLVDASESLTKAKGFQSSLERQARIPAVVDYISSGGRLRLVSSRENIILTLVLAGVRVPRPQEDYGKEALEYVSKRLWQRDVQFSVVNIDKTGGFIGHIYLPGSSIPLSIALVKEGLAEVHEFSAQQSGFQQVLDEAEIEAKKAKKGLWSNYVEQEPVVAPTTTASDNTSSGSSRNYIDILVTSVSPSGTLSYQTGASTTKHSKLLADLASFNLSAANSTQFAFKAHVKRGDSVTVVQGNGKFARGKVLAFDKPDKYTVELVDTGAVKTVGLSALRPLPAQFSLSAIPALAKTAELSFVQTPPANYLDDYVTYLEGKTTGKQLVANIDSPASVSPVSVTLYAADSKGPEDSLNANLIYEGYAFVSPVPSWARDSSWNTYLDSLHEAEGGAKADRVGVWEYGDPRDLED